MEPKPPTTAQIGPVLRRSQRKRRTPDCGGGDDDDDHKKTINNPAPAVVASASSSSSTVCSSSSSSLSRSNFVPIECLTDELLVEILHRLPSTKHVFRCKCVYKRWLNLIASADLNLIGGFIGRRRRQEEELPFGMVAQSNDWWTEDGVCVDNVLRKVTSKEPLFKSRGLFSLDFLPNCEQSESIWILASFNDLLVCCPSFNDYSIFYICNPFTKRWVELPPPPRCSEWARLHQHNSYQPSGRIRVGFTCDPYYYYSSDDDGSDIVKLNSGYRFKLVCIPSFTFRPEGGSSRLFVDIFSSETGEWNSLVLQGLANGFCITSVIAYNGVYWLEEDSPGTTLDGFNLQDSSSDDGVVSVCPFNGLPSELGDIVGIGVCQGNLRILKYREGSVPNGGFYPNFSVWELKELQWSLVHKDIYLNRLALASKDVRLSRYLKSRTSGKIVEGVTFHPSDGDIVYFQFPRFFVMCNMRTRTVEMDGKGSRANILPCNLHHVFSLVLPWWPTPVPVLPKRRN